MFATYVFKELAQQLIALATLTKEPELSPSTHRAAHNCQIPA